MKGVFATIYMSAAEKLNGGVPALFGQYALKIVYLLPMVFLWRSFAAGGADLGGFTLGQLLTYTCVASMLAPQLYVETRAITWNYDGGMIDLYRRPQTVFGQLAMRTIGGWLPELMLFSLPMAVVLPLLHVNIAPETAWFFPCLALSIALGFAVDFLFTCFVIRLQNAIWMANRIRDAVTSLLSGAAIPFALLPWGLGDVFRWLPFGSLAAAPLNVFVGMAAPMDVIPLQIFWNLVLWPLAAMAFRSSRERMVSYGG